MDDEAKLVNTDPDSDFYRRPLAEARELGYSTDELVHRLELTQQIIRNLGIIREQSAGLDELAEKIASTATALRLLRDLEGAA
jgi:hypothetical protein